MTYLIHVLGFFAFILGAGFFAASETALTSLSLSGWERIRHERASVERAYTLWSEHPSLVLAALLLGNMLTSLGASVIANSLGLELARAMHVRPSYFLIPVSFIAGLFILIGAEILPKLYARHYHERVLVRIAWPLVWITQLSRPLIQSMARLADIVRGKVADHPPEPLMTRDELRHALSATRTEGLGASAHRMLTNIMAFDQVKVSEVMIPRAQVVAVGMEANQERVFEHIIRAGFSRIPVFFGNVDNLLGIVYAKDLLVEWRSSGLLVLEDLLRPPYRIAPDAPVSVLLQGFRQGHHMAVVTDSFGRTQGIVTVEDVVEAIVGDIADEFDQPPTSFL